MSYERTSLNVTTNLPFSEWPQIFGDERLTGALLDRLTHRVHIVEMQGESYRLNKSKKRQARTEAKTLSQKAEPIGPLSDWFTGVQRGRYFSTRSGPLLHARPGPLLLASLQEFPRLEFLPLAWGLLVHPPRKCHKRPEQKGRGICQNI